MIKLITAVGEVINRDPDVRERLRVVFLPNFNVTNGQRIYPAADLSEQISTAGKEASGTGNMKFCMNGALTIGTLDGANIELREEVGAENFFLFGLTAQEVQARKSEGYRPADYYAANPHLREVIDLIRSGHFSRGDTELFKPLMDNLMYYDPYMLFADFAAYIECQAKVSEVYRDAEPLDADGDSQHRAQRPILIGSDDSRVLLRISGGCGPVPIRLLTHEPSRKRIVRRRGSAAPHRS